MDIGAINKGKYKGKSKGKHKGKYGNNKGYKGKGYNKGKGYGNNYNSFGNKGGKGKIGQGMPFRGMSNNKGAYNKGKGKGSNKGKGGIQGCYRCGQQGHIARDCKMTVYNISDTTGNNDTYYDTTDQWYQQQQNYDNTWWNSDQTLVNAIPQQLPYYQQQPQLALPAPAQPVQQDTTPTIHIAAVKISSAATTTSRAPLEIPTLQHVSNFEDLMIDSGAATHVCPTWFAAGQQTYELHPTQTPQLRTATEDPIKVYGYKWVYMQNSNNQSIVIPFYVCVTFHNPFCQSTDWQNKASTSPSVISQQSQTATALKQSSNRKMVSTFFQSQQQCHQPRSSMSTTLFVASRQHFHQSPSHQREPNG